MSISGVGRVQSKMRNFIKYSQEDSRRITQRYAEDFVNAVKRNASGRPGPNIVSGEYVGSIKKFTEGPYQAGAETSSPYAMRLEYGFIGTDSLGRHYQQPPLPHWRPAMDEVGTRYLKAMQDAVRRWWR